MSELPGPSGGRSNNGGARAQGPVQQPTTITTPSDIMRKRREREEAKRAADAAKRQPTQRPISGGEGALLRPAAGVAVSPSTSRIPQQQADPNYPTSTQQPFDPQSQPDFSTPSQARPTSSQPRPAPNTSNPRPQSQQPQPRPTASTPSAAAAATASTTRPVQQQPQQSNLPSQTGVSGFPHAFERWETLSSHWEGLTSYWIRRLEQNGEELRREPLLQQLSRQVTDLSAAGANLFHAVVELQKLRQSSERKFQRWHHEMRKDVERQQEISAQMETALIAERQARTNDRQQLQDLFKESQSSRGRTAKQTEEAKRELTIAKDEARRAWEELGRREQEERERTAALREGLPIMIGGMQVFPTGHQSTRAEYDLATDPNRPLTRDGSHMPPGMHGDPHLDQEEQSPTNTDPFTEQATRSHHLAQHPATNGIHAPLHPASAPPGEEPLGAFYGHPNSFLHSAPHQGEPIPALSGAEDSLSYVPSEGVLSSHHDDDDYEYTEHGQIERDAHGRPLLHQRGHALTQEEDDLNIDEELAHERQMLNHYAESSHGVQYPAVPAPSSSRVNPGSSSSSSAAAVSGPQHISGPGLAPPHPTTSAPPPPGANFSGAEPADYEGSGFDAWDRNYHHSRLSGIPEQDEDTRSRVSEASRASRASGKTPRMGPF
jgi:hypothetical protein